jgi:hypothetical protein
MIRATAIVTHDPDHVASVREVYSRRPEAFFAMLDFSQLRADGVGMLLTHPLKDRPALEAPIACSL